MGNTQHSKKESGKFTDANLIKAIESGDNELLQEMLNFLKEKAGAALPDRLKVREVSYRVISFGIPFPWSNRICQNLPSYYV